MHTAELALLHSIGMECHLPCSQTHYPLGQRSYPVRSPGITPRGWPSPRKSDGAVQDLMAGAFFNISPYLVNVRNGTVERRRIVAPSRLIHEVVIEYS